MPARFVRQIDARFSSIADLLGIEGDVVDAGFVANAIEIGIAGLLNAAMQRDTLRALPETLVKMSEEARPAAAVEHGVFVDAAALEARQRDDRFERGAGRPLGLNGTIEQRIARIAGYLLPVLRFDPDGELVRIEVGARRHGQNLSVLRIERDNGAARMRELGKAFVHRQFRHHLKIEVNRELQVLARLRFFDAEDLTLFAAVIDDRLALAVDAHQDVVVLLFDAGFTDDLALVVFRVFRNIEFGFADFSGVTDDVRKNAVVRIEPPLGLDQFHLGKRFGIAMRLDERHVGGRQFVLDRDGLVLRAAAVPLYFAEEVVVIEVQPVGDFVQMFLLEIFAGENQAPGGMVAGDHAPVAVENFASRTNDRHRFDAVALGPFVVDFGALDLQLPEAGDEEEKNRHRGVLECGHFGGGKAGIVA